MRTTRTSDQVTVRLPEGMRDKINRLANANGRSANAEIVARLQATMAPAQKLDLSAIREVVREELERALRPGQNKAEK